MSTLLIVLLSMIAGGLLVMFLALVGFYTTAWYG